MARFKYKMQNILELKMKLEEQQKMALVTARLNLSDEEEKLENLYAQKRKYEEALQEKLREKAFNVFLKELAAEEAAAVDELVAYKYGSEIYEEEWKLDG